MSLGKFLLSDSVISYENDPGEFHVPLADIVEILRFAIDIDQNKGTAEGWFVDPNNKFNLSLSEGKVSIKGGTRALQPGKVVLYPDGIYVTLKTLESWFPIEFDIDFSELTIRLTSLEPLPIEIEAERNERRKTAQNNNKAFFIKDSPLVEYEAPLFNIPFINTSIGSSFNTDDLVQDDFVVNGSVLAEGIFLGQDTELSINTSSASDQDTDIRATLGRTDINSDLLGLGVSQYQFGDIVSQRVPLIAGSGAGRGAFVSTLPLQTNNRSRANTITLRGELQVGYQVDVSRNGALLDFVEEPDENGEYVFDELTVFPGLNVFDLVFYGPQGQRETKQERVFVPVNAIGKGKFGVRAFVLQDNTNLFTNREGADLDQEELRTVVEAEYGLTDTTSVFGAAASLSVEGQDQRYILGGISTSLFGTRLDANIAASEDGGSAFRFQGLGRIGGFNINLEHQFFNDFVSEESDVNAVAGFLRNATELNVTGLLPLGFVSVPINLDVDRFDDDLGNETYDWNVRLTQTISNVRVATAFSQLFQTDQDTMSNFDIQLSSRIGGFNIRGDAFFNVSPETELQSVNLFADYNLDEFTNLRFGISRTGTEDPLNTIITGINRDFGFARIGFDFNANDDSEFGAFLSASFGLAYDPYENKFHPSSRSFVGTGAVSSRTFIDRNQNSVFDEGEEPLNDILFTGQGIDREIGTTPTGYRFLRGLSPNQRNKIEINTASIDDPFLLDTTGVRDFIVRPAGIIKKDYPLILVGEVDGTVEIDKVVRKIAGAGFIVELLDRQGEILKSQEAEFDGFVLISQVPLGDYTARVNPQQLEELGYCPHDSQSITLTEDEPFVTLENFLLIPRPDNGKTLIGILLTDRVHLNDAKFKWEVLKQVFPNSFTDVSAQYQKLPSSYDLKEPLFHLVAGPYERSDQVTNACSALYKLGLPCGEGRWKLCADGSDVIRDSSLQLDIAQYKRLALGSHSSEAHQQH